MILILIISFIILCLTITILHILIFKDRTSTRFWILSDYYWLSFSILGLIGVSKEAFNPFEEQFKKQIKFVIKQQYEQSIEDITKFINIYGDTINAFDDTSMTYEDKRRYERLISRDEEQEWVERNKQIDYINAVKWCRNYRKELINNKTNIVFDSDTDAIQSAIRIIKEHSWDSTKIEEGWHYLSSTKEYLININENIALFNALDTTDSDCEKFVKFFSPFLLAIALGIRLSKVTAQLREASSKTEQLKTN